MAELGFFSGNPKTEWLVDPDSPDRNMKLCEEFTYTDPDERVWLAPAERSINGASIPRPLWTLVGSPYTDDYRCASVVHDIACEDPEVPREEADKMFYWACRAGGCSKSQAAALYAGVRVGYWFFHILGMALKREDLLYRLPGEQTREEQMILDKYREAIIEIRKLGDEPSFADVESILDAKLKG